MSKKKILLKGIAASPGIAEGKVKILHSPADNEKMFQGDILVASETTPEYMPAIFKAKAIVTDSGGILSHPAIVSRELRIPGVVGTFKATKILKDGMEVIVDGVKGIIFSKAN